jgi:hypothetical protein
MLEALLRRAAPVIDDQLDRVYRVADRIATDSTLLTLEHTARVYRRNACTASARLWRAVPSRDGVDRA